MQIYSFSNQPMTNKKVLLRLDLNVPTKNGIITDTNRIDQAIPTIKRLLSSHCKIIIISHMGSPKGKPNDLFTLKPVAAYLTKALDHPVEFLPDCMGKATKDKINQMQGDAIFLLENLRFYPAEENPKEDANFAKQLANYADIYIDDAFGCAHRAHSSIVEICKYFKKTCYTGFLMQKEIQALSALINNPKRPYLAILGGAKIESKIGVIESIAEKVDAIMIVGGMSVIFLKALGYKFFSPLADESSIELAKKILNLLKEKKIDLFLPIDVVLSHSIDNPEAVHIANINEGSNEKEMAVDIGPETIKKFSMEIKKYQTIFWNGPAGVFEVKEFENGTLGIAKAISENNCLSIVGGGDSAFAVEKFGLKSKFTHVSTGGGASLEFIELGTLPGIKAIQVANEVS